MNEKISSIAFNSNHKILTIQGKFVTKKEVDEFIKDLKVLTNGWKSD